MIDDTHEPHTTPSEADSLSGRETKGRKTKFCTIWQPTLPKNNFKNVCNFKNVQVKKGLLLHVKTPPFFRVEALLSPRFEISVSAVLLFASRSEEALGKDFSAKYTDVFEGAARWV